MDAAVESAIEQPTLKTPEPRQFLVLPYFRRGRKDDVIMQECYARLVNEDILGKTMPGMEKRDLTEFLTYFIRPDVATQLAFAVSDNGDLEDVAALLWVRGGMIVGSTRNAYANYSIFRKYQNRVDSYAIWLAIAKYWRDTLGIGIIYGETAVANRAAILFEKRIGMETIGIIPNYLEYEGVPSDVMLSYKDLRDMQLGG